MLRPAAPSFPPRRVSPWSGFASLRRASWIWIVPVGEVHLEPLASLDCCGTSFGGDAEPHAGAGIGDDFPADAFLLPLRGVGEDAAFLRIEHAGRLAAPGLLEFLDRLDHALADFARDRAIILADPGEVGLQRQPLRLRHGVGGLCRLLQGGADRNGRDRFGLVPAVDGVVIWACADVSAASKPA